MPELIYSSLTLFFGLICFITQHILTKKRKKLHEIIQQKQFLKLLIIEQSVNTSWLAFCFLYPHIADLQVNKYINSSYAFLMLLALVLLFKSHSLYEKTIKNESKKNMVLLK